MAAIAFLILFLTLSASSSAIHARDSQFFAKVSNNNPKDSQPLNTNQQDPKFTPQAQDGGSYGLYGHESGQLPPSATNDNLPANLPENYNPVAYTTPIHSSTQDLPENLDEPQTYQYNGDSSMYNDQKQDQFMGNGENMYNSEKQEIGTNGGNMYSSQKQGMSDTRFLENGRYNYAGENAYNSQKQGIDETRFMETEDGGNLYNTQKQENGRYNHAGDMYNSQKQGMGMTKYRTPTSDRNMYNTEKQGMSDTRFLENGRYFHDVNSENLNANANVNSRGFDSKGYYGNNENSYDRYNSNGGYQNQEEYQENQDDQFNP